jgi:GT2 family glycosyltransferase
MEFEGEGIPERLEQARRPLIPLGASLGVGLICPDLGGTMYMVKRECYFAVGGFPRERDIDEDWEFLLNIVAAGFDLQAVPLPLVWYRAHAGTRSRADNRFRRNQSRIRIFEKMLPRELRDLASLAFVRLSNVTDAASQRRLERVLQSLSKVQRERAARPASEDPPAPERSSA